MLSAITITIANAHRRQRMFIYASAANSGCSGKSMAELCIYFVQFNLEVNAGFAMKFLRNLPAAVSRKANKI